MHDLPDNRDSSAITRAIIQMGRSLGLTVIAEGIETEAQREFLAAQGCDELQGRLIGPPLPRADFEALGESAPRRRARPRSLARRRTAHFFLTGRFQPAMATCLPRATES